MNADANTLNEISKPIQYSLDGTTQLILVRKSKAASAIQGLAWHCHLRLDIAKS